MSSYDREKRDTLLYRIYILRCPITKKPRYVGATCQSLKQRLILHLSDVNNWEKLKWIQSLAKKKEFPIIELQCEVTGYWNARKIEKETIIELSKKYSLFNIQFNPDKQVEKIPAKYIIDTLPKKQTK